MLAVAGLILVVIVAWHMWAFRKVVDGTFTDQTAVSDDAIPTINSTTLDAVRAVYTSRETEAAKYRSGVYHYTDPSQ